MVEIAVSKLVMNNDGAEVNRLKIFLNYSDLDRRKCLLKRKCPYKSLSVSYEAIKLCGLIWHIQFNNCFLFFSFPYFDSNNCS